MKSISVLFTSRARPLNIDSFIYSTFDKCDNKNDIEFILKLDDDDDINLEHCKNNLRKDIDIKIITGPRGKGYFDIAKSLNSCFLQAQGTTILLGTDDIVCETTGWDTLIAPWKNDTRAMLWATHYDVGGGLVPIIHRHIIEVLGHIGQCPDVFYEHVSDIINHNGKGSLITKLDGNDGRPLVVFRHVRIHKPTWKENYETWPDYNYDDNYWGEVNKTADILASEIWSFGHAVQWLA